MAKNNWYEAGDQIKKLVQDAVDSGDFSQLSNTITNVVNDAVNGIQSTLQENLSGQRQPRDRNQYTNTEAAERIRREMQERTARGERLRPAARSRKVVSCTVPGQTVGNIMKWSGYGMSVMFGLAAGVLGIIWAATGVSAIGIPTGILAVLFGGSMVLGRAGSGKVALGRRFRRYQAVLGDRTYCLLEELAAAVGQNVKFVARDLKKMFELGYFKEGYLDSKETLLITDREMYQQYLSTQTEYERRRAEKELQGASQEKRTADPDTSHRAGQAADAGTSYRAGQAAQTGTGSGAEQAADQLSGKNLPPECREILESGRKYVQHIHECNEKLPGEEITEKLNHLELVVTKIFRAMERDPGLAGDLKKMMSYYLPTTTKLLDAYCEMEALPVNGQNIAGTKKEIEDALDTINLAFENLLDSLFQGEAWDISSDISVLNTMLAQEGLTGNDFGR